MSMTGKNKDALCKALSSSTQFCAENRTDPFSARNSALNIDFADW